MREKGVSAGEQAPDDREGHSRSRPRGSRVEHEFVQIGSVLVVNGRRAQRENHDRRGFVTRQVGARHDRLHMPDVLRCRHLVADLLGLAWAERCVRARTQSERQERCGNTDGK